MVSLPSKLARGRYLPYLGYSADSVEYLVHIDPTLHMMFVEVPKAGCTVVKTALQRTAGAQDVVASQSVHSRELSPLIAPRQSGLSRRDLFGSSSTIKRVTFVRNPYTRALSAYLDKIVGREAERRVRLPGLGFAPTADLTFSEFLLAVRRQKRRRMDFHWAPQTMLLGLPRVSYHYIGRFEHLHSDLRGLYGFLGSPLPTGVLERTTDHATGAGDRLHDYYGDVELTLVQNIYASDFSRLGYGLGLPPS